jgi:hypothetical protein
MSNAFNIKRTETNGNGVALNSVAHPRPTNKIDVIIDALSVAQNSVWSALNEQALAAARELQAEKQEPVAYYWRDTKACYWIADIPLEDLANLDVSPLYTAPPRKEWVGLTDEEIKEVLGLNEAPWSLSGVALQHVIDDARALEAKLKEKNT